jgi:pyruvate kinase
MEQQHSMNRLSSSKTKIIATVGPAISSEEKLREIILSGIDICRINFSHGNFSEHEAVIELIRKINRETGTDIAILGDLQGPKIRLGLMEEEGVMVNEGDILTLTNIESYGTSSRVYISYSTF